MIRTPHFARRGATDRHFQVLWAGRLQRRIGRESCGPSPVTRRQATFHRGGNRPDDHEPDQRPRKHEKKSHHDTVHGHAISLCCLVPPEPAFDRPWRHVKRRAASLPRCDAASRSAGPQDEDTWVCPARAVVRSWSEMPPPVRRRADRVVRRRWPRPPCHRPPTVLHAARNQCPHTPPGWRHRRRRRPG